MEKQLILSEIEINDGEFAKDELDKDLEKSLKETEKELEKSVKIVDEINDAEAGKPELKDVDGKKVKFTEGLINEDGEDLQEMIDYLVDIYDNDAELILDDILKTECADKVIPALYNNAKEFDEWEPETPLDEDIRDVKGLGNAYKKARFFAHNSNIDYHNAEYKEITPEEAIAAFKQGKGDGIRLLIDGKLVTIKDRGYGSSDYNTRVRWVPSNKRYTKKSGEEVTDTTYMPLSHLVNIADKIILTNERETKRDQDLINKRAENPASRNYGGDDLQSIGPNVSNKYKKDHEYDGDFNIRGYNSGFAHTLSAGKKSEDNYYNRKVIQAKDELTDLKRKHEAGELSDDEYKELYKNAFENYKYYTQRTKQQADNFARARYVDSERSLQKELVSVSELRKKAVVKKKAAEESKEELDAVIANGAESTIKNKALLDDYSNQLKEIQKKMAMIEFKLEDTSEEDAAAAKKYQDAYDKANNEYNEVTSELAKIFNRRKK